MEESVASTGDGSPQSSSVFSKSSAPTSYSDRLKTNIKKSERLKRNVLEINLEEDGGKRIFIAKETIAKLLSKIGIDIKTSVIEGYQICPRKIFVWLHESHRREYPCD